MPDSEAATPVWQVRLLDQEGPFAPHEAYGWQSVDSVTLGTLLDKLGNLETMTWSEILAAKKINHPISTDSICPAAQKRLKKLGRESCDTLYSLGPFGSLARLLGIREGRIFQVLWWDPEHRVCPSIKKHT